MKKNIDWERSIIHRPKPIMINIDKFRKYLDYLYIKKKTDQDKIIRAYKTGLKEYKRISYLRDIFEDLDYSEDTIYKVIMYVINTTRRNFINEILENCSEEQAEKKIEALQV